ncbi:hypothetical protein FACS189485_19500 [Spirochaetia bacterium]|nr:hypothetical protein FACS189485_19500 [Spirochaetia bacterium]
MEMPQFFTIDETAKILRISKVTVNRKLSSGEIKAIRLGRRVLIPASYFVGLAAAAWPEPSDIRSDGKPPEANDGYGE